MLEEKKDIPTAIQMLFYFGDADKDPKEDFKNLSVILDSTELVKVGYSTISAAFTNRLNEDSPVSSLLHVMFLRSSAETHSSALFNRSRVAGAIGYVAFSMRPYRY